MKLTPTSASLVLKYYGVSSDEVLLGGSANTILRAIANFSPAKLLLGASNIQAAQTDGWASFIWSSIEVPLQALAIGSSGLTEEAAVGIHEDLDAALTRVNAHLLHNTFLVGTTSITIADISLFSVLIHATALKEKLREGSCYPNLSRWFDTLLHQPFVSVAQQVMSSPSKFYNPIHGDGAMTLNGTAPPVVPKLFKRHRIRMKELFEAYHTYINMTITVAGWARTTRNANKGQLLFIELNDGSTQASLQCLLEVDKIPNFDECKGCGGAGASFQISGTIVRSPGDAAKQVIELQAESAILLGPVYGGANDTIGGMLYPLSKKNHTLEHMRENAHLRARTKLHSAAMRIRHAMAYATHKFFHDHGFLYVHTPIITGADCEGAGEQFAVTTMLTSDPHTVGVTLPVHKAPEVLPEDAGSKKSSKKNKQKKGTTAAAEEEVKIPGTVDYSGDFFSKRVNLTVSGQLNVETHCCAMSDVYTFGPTFRAENSHTSRHLAEFWMIEPEIAFATLEDDMNLAEDYLKYCVQYALENCADDLEFFDEVCTFGEKGLRTRLRCVLAEPFKVRTP